MTCPHCLSPLIIDEWGGWRWWCIRCDLHGRRATDDEIEAQERTIQQNEGGGNEAKTER